MEDYVGPRDSLDAVELRKFLALDGNRTPAVQPVAKLTDITQLLNFKIIIAKLSWNFL
jgi:hypothetical protein